MEQHKYTRGHITTEPTKANNFNVKNAANKTVSHWVVDSNSPKGEHRNQNNDDKLEPCTLFVKNNPVEPSNDCNAQLQSSSNSRLNFVSQSTSSSYSGSRSESSFISQFPIKNYYQCNICNRFFSSANGLQAHRPVHNKPVSHTPSRTTATCDICGKVLNSRTTLIQHTRIHTGAKPYKCVHCEMSFRKTSTLKAHVYSKHTGWKPYTCNLCQQSFVQVSSVNYHFRYHHPEIPRDLWKAHRTYHKDPEDKGLGVKAYADDVLPPAALMLPPGAPQTVQVGPLLPFALQQRVAPQPFEQSLFTKTLTSIIKANLQENLISPPTKTGTVNRPFGESVVSIKMESNAAQPFEENLYSKGNNPRQLLSPGMGCSELQQPDETFDSRSQGLKCVKQEALEPGHFQCRDMGTGIDLEPDKQDLLCRVIKNEPSEKEAHFMQGNKTSPITKTQSLPQMPSEEVYALTQNVAKSLNAETDHGDVPEDVHSLPLLKIEDEIKFLPQDIRFEGPHKKKRTRKDPRIKSQPKKQKRYECNICGKMVAQQASLKEHMYIHLDQRPHKCVHCGKGFRKKSALSQHVPLHTSSISELFPTHITFMWFLTCMCQYMHL